MPKVIQQFWVVGNSQMLSIHMISSISKHDPDWIITSSKSPLSSLFCFFLQCKNTRQGAQAHDITYTRT